MKDLNLIPKSYLLAKQKKIKRIRTIITVILSSILVAVCIVIPLFLEYNLQIQLDSVKEGIEETNGYKITQERLDDVKQKYSERELIANSLAKYGLSAVTVLEKIEKGVPEKLFITNLNIGSESGGKVQITMTGICATEDDVASFVLHLREDNYYSDIVISSIKKTVVEQNLQSISAIIGKTINDSSVQGKTVISKPTPGKIQPTNKKNTDSKTVENVKSTPTTPTTFTCFNFNISLYLKIKK